MAYLGKLFSVGLEVELAPKDRNELVGVIVPRVMVAGGEDLNGRPPFLDGLSIET